MNRGQVLIPEGDGRWKYRDDVATPVSALAVEAWRAVKANRAERERLVAKPMGAVTTHICEGPKPTDEDWIPDARLRKPALIDRVLEALRASWRSKTKLQERDLCERLNASMASKRVEKALRKLCNEGLAQREGNRRSMVYWPSTTESST